MGETGTGSRMYMKSVNPNSQTSALSEISPTFSSKDRALLQLTIVSPSHRMLVSQLDAAGRLQVHELGAKLMAE